MLTIATAFVALAMLLALIKLIVSKSTSEKVVVIDVVSIQFLALTFLLAIHDHNTLPLQFGVVLALLGFVSTVLISHLIRTHD